ncbi:MAG: type II secretion system protein [Peptococcaceae bacterium]
MSLLESQLRLKRSIKFNSNNSGFTLLEISLVVVLLGIALGIAIPSLQKPYARYQLQVAARQLVSDIRYLEQTAQSRESNNYQITFDFTNDCYYMQENTVTLPNGYKKLPGSVDMNPTDFPYNILNIKQYGTVANNGHVCFHSRNGAGNLYVIVYQHTGRVRLSDQPP